MPKTKTKTEETAVEQEELIEDRIDEYGLLMFQNHLGFEGRLPDGLVQLYLDYKRVKDRMTPGRLSPEGFAMVVTLYSILGR